MNMPVKLNKKMHRLNSMLVPALFTLGRGIRLGEGGYGDEKFFTEVRIDRNGLKRYKGFFGFSGDLPLPYLYLFAQRAQISMMLEKGFPLGIPGLVQIDNELSQLDDMDPFAPFEVTASVRIPFSDEGTVRASFAVDFIQKNRVAARCASTYVSRRPRRSDAGRPGMGGAGKNRAERKKDEPPAMQAPSGSEQWILDKNMGWNYAKVSGDYNPIHLFKAFAKMVGFPRPIVQGWYSASRAAAALERASSQKLRDLRIVFKKPIYLPGSAVFGYRYPEEGKMEFILKNDRGEILANGTARSG